MKNLLLIRDTLGLLWQSATSIATGTGTATTTAATDTKDAGVAASDGAASKRWIVSTSIDSPSQRLFACSNDHLLIAFDLHSAKAIFVISLRGGGVDSNGETQIPLIDASDVIIHTQYLPELEAVAIATNDGVLLTANVVTHAVEEVGNIVGGLSCVSWSPDHELCALATRTNRSILLMTKEWNVIAEVPISGGEEKGTASGGETNGIISWRGDAQYFVCSSYDPVRGTRRLRVYNQQAQLQSASEAFPAVDGKEVRGQPTEGLSAVLSWRPSGSLIASSMLRKIGKAGWKHEVVFFERNGLRHGQFSLGVLGGEGEKYSGVKDISSAVNTIINMSTLSSSVPSMTSSSGGVKMSAIDRAIEDAKRRDKDGGADDDNDDNDGAASDDNDDNDDNDDQDDDDDSKSSLPTVMPSTSTSPSVPSLSSSVSSAAVSLPSSSQVAASIPSSELSIIAEERLQVVDMQWNSESDLLAMVVRILDSDDIIVQLWHQNNYHWYLKNAINIAGVHGAIDHAGGVRIRFDAENAMRLMIIAGASVRWLEWCWDVQVSDNGSRTAAVIDGARLLLTPLAHVVTPPPMAARTITLTQAINSLSFCSRPLHDGVYASFGEYGASISCLTSNLTLRLMPCVSALPAHLRAKYRVLPELSPTSINIRSALEEYGPLGQVRLHQWLSHTRIDGNGSNDTSIDTHTIILVESNVGSADAIIEVTFETRPNTQPEILDVFRTASPAGVSIIRLFSRSDRGYVGVHMDDGRVLRYNPECWNESMISSAGPSLIPLSSLPLPCPCFAVVDLAGKETVIGKDQRGKFYCEQTMLSPQCLSFGLGQQYVAFTVGGEQNAMFFIDKSLTLDQNISVEFRSDPHSLRYVERGSSIVAIVPGVERPRAVLQMPRGNLETVYPRALTLSSVNVSLSKHEYRTAILTLRANRVDLNLLYDHNPAEFCQHAERFVRDVSDPELINLFLSGLTNEDCTKTQYPRYQALPSILRDSITHDDDMKLGAVATVAGSTAAAGTKKKEGPEFETLAASVALAAARDEESKKPLIAAGVTKAKETHRKAHSGPKPKALDDATPHHRDIRYREKRTDIELVDDTKLVDIHAHKTKVNRICDVIIDVLHKVDEHHSRYLLSLLTAHAMKSPPDLNAALTIIRTIRTRERGGRAAVAPVIAIREAPKAQGQSAAPVDDDEEEAKAAATRSGGHGNNNTSGGAGGKAIGDDDDEDLPVLSIAASSTVDATTKAPTSGNTASASSSSAVTSVTSSTGKSSGGPIFTKPATGGAGGLSGDACLKYIIFLADVNQLFDAALSMYDFDMVMQVAQYSQKDPKEYIPFLTRLQSLSSHVSFQRYSIDVHLKNYSSALTNLHAAIYDTATSNDQANQWFTLCCQLITNQGPLLAQAVKLFAPKQIFIADQKDDKKSSSSDISISRWYQLMSLYGDWLQSRGSHRDAAVAYLTCRNWTKAVACFKEAGEWRSAFVTATQLKLSSSEITKLASEVVVQLINASRYLEASHAAMDYLKDLEQAVLLLVRGEEWAECVRLAHLHGRADLLVTNVLPDLQTSYVRHHDELKSRYKRYAYSTSRLRLVRRNKLLYPRQQHEMLDDRDEELESLVSGVSGRTESSALSVSGVSISSRSSTASTASTASSLFSVEIEQNREMTRDEKNIAKALKRNQRKAIKRPKIKEGSLNEEDALIGEVRSSTPSIKYKEQMTSLIRALVHFEMIDRAVLLHRDWSLLLTLVRDEEMKPMPAIANVPADQSLALLRHWNWPQSAYNRSAPASFTNIMELYAGTTAGETPTQWLVEWLADIPLINHSLSPSSLINELRTIHDRHAAAIAAGGIVAPTVPRKDHHVKKRGPKGTKEELSSEQAAALAASWKNNNDNDHDTTVADEHGLGLFA